MEILLNLILVLMVHITIGVVHHSWQDSYFCKFKCLKKHTVCHRKGCLPSKKCGRNVQAQLTDTERALLLNTHNKLRSIIATGQDQRKGNNMSSNMNALSYSLELEYVAQCWANACEYSHDKCRTTRQFEYPGQNIYEKYGLSDFKGTDYLRLALQSWFDQIVFVNKKLLQNYSDKGSIYYREFTQMVWASTTHVGCGKLSRERGLKNFILLVCNYGPRGNIVGENVYEEGEACTSCPIDMPCDSLAKYSSLCGSGDIKTWKNDPWEPPFSKSPHFHNYLFLIITIIYIKILHLM